MKRYTCYLDEETAERVDAERPGFLSQSGWIALLAKYGLEQHQRVMRPEGRGE